MKKFITTALAIVFVVATFMLSASAYWSDSYKITYNGGESTYTMDEDIPYVPKMSEDAYAEFQGAYITSWAKPQARLVNSQKQSRSGWVKLDGDAIFSTTDVSAVINHYYYAEIEGAWNQVGEDSMRFRYNPY